LFALILALCYDTTAEDEGDEITTADGAIFKYWSLKRNNSLDMEKLRTWLAGTGS
jgi:hypothetical protein